MIKLTKRRQRITKTHGKVFTIAIDDGYVTFIATFPYSDSNYSIGTLAEAINDRCFKGTGKEVKPWY